MCITCQVLTIEIRLVFIQLIPVISWKRQILPIGSQGHLQARGSSGKRLVTFYEWK